MYIVYNLYGAPYNHQTPNKNLNKLSSWHQVNFKDVVYMFLSLTVRHGIAIFYLHTSHLSSLLLIASWGRNYWQWCLRFHWKFS